MIVAIVPAAGRSQRMGRPKLLLPLGARPVVEHVLRAIGASRGNIFRLVWLETIQVCFIGAAAGVLVAFLASRAIEAWVRARLPFAPTDALIHWEWWIVAACLACALLLGTLAGFLPAWRAAAIPPMSAIRAAGGRL